MCLVALKSMTYAIKAKKALEGIVPDDESIEEPVIEEEQVGDRA